ncbi:MAG: DMT family transporter [Candidatus Levybacteria bacterium]|nr:DMT family transporter [Candidatus Levybacteria bacterium]
MKLTTLQKAIFALIIANIIWGAAAPIFKWSLESTPPFTLAVLRFGLSTLLVLPFVKGKFKIYPKDFLAVFIIALTGITINISFFFLGLEFSDSINAPIIASSAPLFIILFGFLFLKDKLHKKTIIGGLIGLLGVLVIVVIPSIEKGFDTSLLGNVFFILAMFGSVISAILLKKIIKRYDPITLVFWSFLIGTVGFLPMFFDEIQRVGFLPIVNSQVIIGILFGAFLSSGVGYYLHTWAIKYMPVEDVGLFVYMDPVVAILVAYPLLGETPNVHFVIGSVLVFLGIFVAEGRLHYHPFHKLIKKR